MAKNLQLIQLLRGIAALLVVLLHTTVSCAEKLNTTFLFNFFKFGGTGVDIFFVLSGFIITYTNYNGIAKPKKFGSFVQRRFVRIFPTYWIIITIYLIVQVLLPAFYRTHFPLNISTLISTYFLFAGHAMVNGVSWTLTYELFFYLLFSFSFFIPNKKISLAIVIGYVLIIMILTLAGIPATNENSWIGVALYPMNIEFFAGVIAAVIIPRLPDKFSMPFIIAGAVVFLISGIMLDTNAAFFSSRLYAVFLFGLPSFLIICGLVKYELNNRINLHSLFLSLGEASYSLYLLHLPLLVALCKVIVLLKFKNVFLIHVLMVLMIIIISSISIFFYKRVEKPIITRINSLRKIKVANEI